MCVCVCTCVYCCTNAFWSDIINNFFSIAGKTENTQQKFFCFEPNKTQNKNTRIDELHVQCMSLDWRFYWNSFFVFYNKLYIKCKYFCLFYFFFPFVLVWFDWKRKKKMRMCYKKCWFNQHTNKTVFKLNLVTETVLSVASSIDFNQFFFSTSTW